MVKNYNEMLYNNRRIELDRLILRPFEVGDAHDLFECIGDEESVRYLMQAWTGSLEEARSRIYDTYLATPNGYWAIEHKESGKMIGNIVIKLNHDNDRAHFGYVLNKAFWGKGYAGEALKAIVDLCFMQLEVNRVGDGHYVGNEASGRVMEKVGLKLEGTLRGYEKIRGVQHDLVIYGLTRDAYLEGLQ